MKILTKYLKVMRYDAIRERQNGYSRSVSMSLASLFSEFNQENFQGMISEVVGEAVVESAVEGPEGSDGYPCDNDNAMNCLVEDSQDAGFAVPDCTGDCSLDQLNIAEASDPDIISKNDTLSSPCDDIHSLNHDAKYSIPFHHLCAAMLYSTS